MYKTSGKLFEENPHLAQRIEQCVDTIKRLWNPEKVVLFGSYARGEIYDNGTMDILIVVEDTKLPFFERIKKTLIGCKGGYPSVEPIVYTRKEFNSLLQQGEGFLEDALEEGIVIYEDT